MVNIQVLIPATICKNKLKNSLNTESNPMNNVNWGTEVPEPCRKLGRNN